MPDQDPEVGETSPSTPESSVQDPDSLSTRVPLDLQRTWSDQESIAPDLNPSIPTRFAVDLDSDSTYLPNASSNFDSWPSRDFPGYEQLDSIGEGGMGVVFRARQVGLNRTVALKMTLGGRASPRDLIRFLAEAEVVASIRHPNVVQVYEFGQSHGRPFLAMEYLPGGSLVDRLKSKGRLDPNVAVGLVGQLARAVQAAHEKGIVHRDLKPANVLFDECGEPRVTDFGLAKRTTGGDLTQTKAVMGTPAYMAPEQARGDNKFVGPQADVYALGVILYECLTGIRPFQDTDTHLLLRKVIEDDPERPSRHVPGLPRDLELIALKCLSKDPSDRYRDGGALAEELERFERGESVEVRATGPLERVMKWARRKPTLAASYALTTLVLLLIGFGASLAVLWRSAERARAAEKEARVAERFARDRLDRFTYGRTVQAAYQESVSGNKASGRILLASTREEFRGWEWNYVNRLCRTELLELKRHVAGLTSASFSPDGSKLVTSSWDSSVRVWDAREGVELGVVLWHRAPVQSATFSPDGLQIVSAGDDKVARVWDARSGEQRATLEGHTQAVLSASFSGDGTRVVTASADKSARIWDARTGKPLMTLGPIGHRVNWASFSPDGTRVVTAGADKMARIWDAHSGLQLLELKGHKDALRSASFSGDGTRVLTASVDKTARVWDAKLGTPILAVTDDAGALFSATFSPDGSRIATSGFVKTARVWDAQSGIEQLRLEGHTDRIFSVSFSPDGSRLATASADKSARVWDAHSGLIRLDLKGHKVAVRSASFRPDSLQIVTASDDRTARVWDARTGVEQHQLKGHDGAVSSASFSPDGTRIVTASVDRTVRVWDARTGTRILTVPEVAAVSSASFSPDGTRIVTASVDRTVRVWDARTGGFVSSIPEVGAVSSASFSPDGRRIITAGKDKTARVWDARKGHRLLELKGHEDAVNSASFSPDGRRIITAGADKTARVWDARTGKSLMTLEGHADAVESASFSPDGSRIVTGGRDRSARIWDAQFGVELLRLDDPEGPILSVQFSPDGTRIAGAGMTAWAWDTRPESRQDQVGSNEAR
ncbi:protein kinase domain-containing protein [Tundrisphaera lichenicola]|uniref:protein kinase domain-containing protein n=1 Tax=Tundrisphaera lichenicola TaxID=2029860 RepID=UPI003EC02D70